MNEEKRENELIRKICFEKKKRKKKKKRKSDIEVDRTK